MKPRIFLLFNGIIKKKKKVHRKEEKEGNKTPWMSTVRPSGCTCIWDDMRRKEPWPDGMRNKQERTARSYRSSRKIIQHFYIPLYIALPLWLCLRLISCAIYRILVDTHFRQESVVYTFYADRQIPAGNLPILLFLEGIESLFFLSSGNVGERKMDVLSKRNKYKWPPGVWAKLTPSVVVITPDEPLSLS